MAVTPEGWGADRADPVRGVRGVENGRRRPADSARRVNAR
ncbi:hypothetical protein KPATCC21470_6143 [Kitasatospora purpeofusca]